MGKKLITACLALVALAAFAVPATASAATDPDLTCSKAGPLCAVGTKISAHNIGILKMTGGSAGSPSTSTVLTECTTAFMTGTLTENSGTSVKGNITTADFGGTGTKATPETIEPECTSTFGNFTVTTNVGNGVPWCLSSTPTMAADEFQVRGNECSKEARSITFLLESTTIGECGYERTAAIPGTYTTEATGDAVLSFFEVEFKKHLGGLFCPAVGFLDMSFTLEQDTNATHEKTTNTTTDPLYIS